MIIYGNPIGPLKVSSDKWTGGSKYNKEAVSRWLLLYQGEEILEDGIDQQQDDFIIIEEADEDQPDEEIEIID